MSRSGSETQNNKVSKVIPDLSSESTCTYKIVAVCGQGVINYSSPLLCVVTLSAKGGLL